MTNVNPTGSTYFSKTHGCKVRCELQKDASGNVTGRKLFNHATGTEITTPATPVIRLKAKDSGFAQQHANNIDVAMRQTVAKNLAQGLHREANETEKQHANRMKVYKRAQAYVDSTQNLTEAQFTQKLSEMGAAHTNKIVSRQAANEARDNYNNHLETVIQSNQPGFGGIGGIGGKHQEAITAAQAKLNETRADLQKAQAGHTIGNAASLKILRDAEKAYNEANLALVKAKEEAVGVIKNENETTQKLLQERSNKYAIAKEDAEKVTKLHGQQKAATENRAKGKSNEKNGDGSGDSEFKMPDWAMSIIGKEWTGRGVRLAGALAAFLTFKWLFGNNNQQPQVVYARPVNAAA